MPYMAYTRIICITYLCKTCIDYFANLKGFNALFYANYMWRKRASNKRLKGTDGDWVRTD